MAHDPVPELAGRVRALDQQPLDEHPDVLEQVHREIVAELDRLGGRQRSTGESAPSG